MADIVVFYQNNKKLEISNSDEIQRGGEGRIMLLRNDPDKVAKLYHPHITPLSELKFNFLTELDESLFVKPLHLLFDKSKKVAGYIMKYLDNSYFPLSQLFSKNFCIKNNISAGYKTTIAEKLLKALLQAHTLNLIVGDFNQYNILINLNADVKLIDTDSYQVPGTQHSGLLLEDIRDYLYSGVISIQSDYFAISVLVFYLFTYLHPFKGIHPNYKSLSERMVHKKPVFCTDTELVLPKCYEPLQNTEIQDQYNKLYLNGDRFLLQIDKPVIAGVAVKTTKTKMVVDNLTITNQLINTKINQSFFYGNGGYVKTDTNYILYSCPSKGFMQQVGLLSVNECVQVFVTNNGFMFRHFNQLYLYASNNQHLKIDNFEFKANSIVHQMGQVVSELSEDYLTEIFVNKVFNNKVEVKRNQVFSPGIRFLSSYMQNTGGVQRIFYSDSKDLISVKLTITPKDLIQVNNYAIVQHIKSKKVVHEYIKIKGFTAINTGVECNGMLQFACALNNTGEGYLFEPSDGAIKVYETVNFTLNSVLKCDLISENTALYYTLSGIVAVNEMDMNLLNTK